MEIRVTPEVFHGFPGMRIAVIGARGVDASAQPRVVETLWREAYAGAAALGATISNAQSHPHVQPWRHAWKRLGISVKKFPSSIEALLRRAMKGGEPFTINPLVDFYNAVSLLHVAPAGGFDAGQLEDGVLELRCSRSSDRFQALDEDEPIEVQPGEIVYATGSEVLTRHLVWRQSRRALLGPTTRDLILVSEILDPLPDELVCAVGRDLTRGVRQNFDAVAESAVLTAGHPTASFVNLWP